MRLTRQNPDDAVDRRASGGGALWFLWATMLAGGVPRLAHRDDIPFGVMQLSAVSAGVLMTVVRLRRAARWAVMAVLTAILLGCGITELLGGHSIMCVAVLALAPIPLVVEYWRQRSGPA